MSWNACPVRLDLPLLIRHSHSSLDLGIFKKLIYILFGIYAWEIVNTMHVERALVLRIRSFRWPQSMSIVLLLASLTHSLTRLSYHSPLLPLPLHPPSGTHWLVSHHLCALHPPIPTRERVPQHHTSTQLVCFSLIYIIHRLIGLSVTTQTDCQALFVFIQWAGNTTIGASTSLLLIRTIAVWNRSLYIIAPMLLLAAGQWGLLYYSKLTTAGRSSMVFPYPIPISYSHITRSSRSSHSLHLIINREHQCQLCPPPVPDFRHFVSGVTSVRPYSFCGFNRCLYWEIDALTFTSVPPSSLGQGGMGSPVRRVRRHWRIPCRPQVLVHVQ